MDAKQTILLIGRKAIVIDDVRQHLPKGEFEFYSAVDLNGVKEVFSHSKIDMVFMGAGIELEPRLEIVRYIFETSGSTSVHLKDVDSGPQAFLPFVANALRSFAI